MRSCYCSTHDAFLFAEEYPLVQLLACVHPLLFSPQEKRLMASVVNLEKINQSWLAQLHAAASFGDLLISS